MTVSALPRELRPAVRTKGTVRPSEKPRVKSERNLVRPGLLEDGAMVIFEVGETEERVAEKKCLY